MPPAKPERPARDGDVVVAAVGRLARPRRRRRVEIHVAGDEQIQMTVTVVVQETAAGAPARPRSRDAGSFRDVRERAVAVVAVEHVVAPVGDEQIVEAVVVVVADATGLPPAGMGQPGLRGDVGERAVAVVVEQVAGGLRCPAPSGRGCCRSPGRCRASRRGRSRRRPRRSPSPRAGTACCRGCRTCSWPRNRPAAR